ncbi:hypothetical protein BaRGS_00033710 [Batillaria attramentaria]|uniref:Sulfotransferase domain-containing protein n=1 Tax=Batillaria attramentaria TaxID=370345 RepID=A0ABD0JJ87_9CAEN|nr:hypothetical protein BaRGS_018085 [Batillaria attramentaria]
MPARQFPDGRGAYLQLEEIEGVLYPVYHDHIEQQLQDVRQLHVRDDDVILCTYPKAGTHWVWEVLTMLRRRSSTYCPDMKRTAMLENVDLDLVRSQPSPRVLNTHLLPRALPAGTWNSRARLVVFHRNPKDTVVSLYNMARQVSYNKFKSAFEGCFEGYADLFLKGTVPHGSWFDYVRAWEEVRSHVQPGRLYVGHYEDMHRDPVGEVSRLAAFLDIDASAELCRQIADACSFHKLKAASGAKRGAQDQGIWKPNATGIFRKGQVGDWKNWMTLEMSAAFDTAFNQRLHGLNIHFTFD